MTYTIDIENCFLCNREKSVRPAPFKQLYPQKDHPPVEISWNVCRECKGYFAHPAPDPDVIKRHWGTINYNKSPDAQYQHTAKIKQLEKVLHELALRSPKGKILDVGSNFGNFLLSARAAGWEGYGFEPFEEGAEVSRQLGFDTHCAWKVEDVEFAPGMFQAITAFDTFCYVWHPYSTLVAMFNLLSPGGTLAMRVTNKRHIINLAINITKPGQKRNTLITRLLQNQYHSITVDQLRKIMGSIGFTNVKIERMAVTGTWSELSLKTKVAYIGAEVLYYLSLASLNLTPGALIYGTKPLD